MMHLVMNHTHWPGDSLTINKNLTGPHTVDAWMAGF